MIVILPGVGRPASMLAFWGDLLPCLVRAMDYPRIATLEGLADYFAQEIPREALVVGESMGGLVALALAQRGYRVIAFDPPLTMAKQQSIQLGIRGTLANYPPSHMVHAMAASIFGVMPGGVQEERDYYPLLRAPRKVTIVTGTGFTCAIDPEDEAELTTKPNVEFFRIPGPHALLTENIEGSRAAIELIYSRTNIAMA